jgi:hypothetical protein
MIAMRKLLSFVLLTSVVASGQNAIPSLTVEQWRQDLDYFVNEITTKHRDPYHFSNKPQFDEAVTNLRERIASMKDYEVVVGLQHLAALVGDGHTFIDTSNLYARFPMEVFWFGNDLRVIRAAPEYKQALGARITAIGSFPIGEVESRLRPLIPEGENEWYVLNSSAEQMMKVEPLAALGVLPDLGPAEFALEDDSGHSFRLRIRPVAGAKDHSGERTKEPVSLPFLHPEQPFWFTYLPDSKTVYAVFRSYQDLQMEAARLLEFIANNPVQKLIVDMRWNGGGDYTKGREYLIYKLAYLPTVNKAGHLFVITGRETFSAAMTNVTDFRRETEAILVGEPTGARPNGYQENYWFTLPFSKLRASCAMLKYRFQPLSEVEAVFPDHRIDPDWKLFSRGEDAALRWILARDE